MCMESGPVRLQRRLAEVSQAGAGPTQDHPRMISSIYVGLVRLV